MVRGGETRSITTRSLLGDGGGVVGTSTSARLGGTLNMENDNVACFDAVSSIAWISSAR